MSRWFRFYSDAMRHPKVARLADKDFRLWCDLLCVAAEREGKIPPMDDLKHLLKRRLDHLSAGVERLISGGLITRLEGGYAPHGWQERQYISDSSTPRVRKYRAKCNVSETTPDTEADTDCSVSLDTGAAAPFDPASIIFKSGVALITAAGKSEAHARSWLGKARRDYGDEPLIAAIGAAKREGAIDPIGFMQRALRHKSRDEWEYTGP